MTLPDCTESSRPTSLIGLRSAPEGARVVRAIARRLARFDWTQVEHDILKVLYESVIDTDTRHRLGEYYTPDWLAQRMVDTHVSDPLTDRVLDPACGSGTFLFWAVRRVLDALDAAAVTNKQALEHVVAHVSGVDLHPVAVTLARVTYLLAIGRDRLTDRGALTIPVFLGDSVRWEQDASLLQQGGITVRTSDGMELFAQELHFPEGVLEDPGRFDRLVAALADKAADPHRASIEPRRLKDNRPSTKAPQAPDISGILALHHVPAADRGGSDHGVREALSPPRRPARSRLGLLHTQPRAALVVHSPRAAVRRPCGQPAVARLPTHAVRNARTLRSTR